MNGSCYYGQLTDHGRDLLKSFGSNLRDIYVKYLGFLPSEWTPESSHSVYFRSTYFPRTLESLQSLFSGLYSIKEEVLYKKPEIIIHTRQEEIDNMYPWTKCARLRVLQKQFKSVVQKQASRDISHLNEKMKPLLSIPDSYGAFPSFHGIYDVLYSAKLHNYDLVKMFQVEEEDFKKLERVVAKESFFGFQKSDEMVRLGIGRFVRDLLFAFKEKLGSINHSYVEALPIDPPTGLQLLPTPVYKGISNIKLMVFSGHDSSIAPLSAAFGVFDGLWPQFGANLVMELIEDTASRKNNNNSNASTENELNNFYIRLKGNDQVFQMPGCAQFQHPNDDSLCQVEQFFKLCSNIIPRDLQEECASSIPPS